MAKPIYAFNEDWIPEITQMIKDGMLKRQIAEHFGLTKSVFEYYARKYGFNKLKTNDRRFARIPLNELQQLYYEDKMPIYKIAEKYDVSEFTIRRQLRINLNGSHADIWNSVDKNKVCDLYVKGLTVKQVSTELNIPTKHVKSILDENNIKTRMALDYNKKQLCKYKDKNLRSGYEIVVAQYLDENDYNWKYEEKIFNLGIFKYRPDFFVYDKNNNLLCIIEVKGWVREEAFRKLMLFEELYPDTPIIFWDKEDIDSIKQQLQEVA